MWLPRDSVGIQCARARIPRQNLLNVYYTYNIYTPCAVYAYLRVMCHTYYYYISYCIQLEYISYIASARANDCEQTNFDDFTQSWPRVYSAVYRSTGKLILTKTIFTKRLAHARARSIVLAVVVVVVAVIAGSCTQFAYYYYS